MDFSPACDCGATHAVAKGQAGSTIACGCGRLIDVPSLAKLRAQAGLSAVERGPEERIPPLVASGELPGRECAVCRGPCDELFPLTAVCEREEALASSGPHMTRNAPWKFFAGLFAGVLHFEWYERREAVTRGRDTVVYIPPPLCSVCRPQFETRRFYGVVPAVMLGLVAGGA